MNNDSQEQADARAKVKPVVIFAAAGETTGASPSRSPAAPRESRWRALACFLLMLTAIQLALGPKIRLSQWELSASKNAGVAEGVSWLEGRLDLPTIDDPKDPSQRTHDTAYFEGKAYNVFPPMMPILTVLLSPLHRTLLDGRTDFWLQTPFVLLVFWPLPIVGFVVFRKRTGDSVWAAVWTLAWMGGTGVVASLHRSQDGMMGQIYHCMSQVGLLILAADILGRQRIWPGLIGLLISTYTRQMTFLFGLPLLWIAWKGGGRRRLAFCTAGLALIAAPMLTLNTLKFGNPLEFGYRHIFVGRPDDGMAGRFRAHGVFSTRFIPESAYYMHAAPPFIDFKAFSPVGLPIRDRNNYGTSIWITTPLLLWIFIAAGQWWRDPNCRVLMLSTLPVMLGLLCYHSPGFSAHGYSRFALDFLPIWLVVIARYAMNGWRTWFTLGCMAWSLLYFHSIVPDTREAQVAKKPVAPAMEHHGQV